MRDGKVTLPPSYEGIIGQLLLHEGNKEDNRPGRRAGILNFGI